MLEVHVLLQYLLTVEVDAKLIFYFKTAKSANVINMYI